MVLRGKAWKFGDDISTDLIAPGRYFHLRSDLKEFAKHVLEDVDSEFAKKVLPGDFVVGGRNFGLGSSREHAPAIIKLAGISCILAKSFARIFFRNGINIGLPVIECDTDKISAQDELEIDFEEGAIKDITKKTKLKFAALPNAMIQILQDGGLIEHIKKHGDFKIE